jgi:hypothetical protein
LSAWLLPDEDSNISAAVWTIFAEVIIHFHLEYFIKMFVCPTTPTFKMRNP